MATVNAKNNTPITPIESGSTESLLSASLAELDAPGGGSESWAGEDTADAADAVEWTDDDSDLEGDDEEAGDAGEEADGSEEADGEEVEAGEDTGKPTSNQLNIEVTDEEGKKTIQFDPSDEKAVTRAVQQAAGARKLYAKYTELKASSEKLKEADANWNKFEALYEEKGIDGVVRLLEGKGIDDLIAEKEAFQQKYNKMSAEQRAAYDRSQFEARMEKRLAAEKAENARIKQEVAAEREAAAVTQLEGYAHTAFAKHSFSGKLGDRARELRLDRIMWNNVQSELEALESAGVPLTNQVVTRVVAESRSALGGADRTETKKAVAASIQKKKDSAARSAQSKVVKGERQVRSEVNKDIDTNSIAGMSQLMVAALRGPKRK